MVEKNQEYQELAQKLYMQNYKFEKYMFERLDSSSFEQQSSLIWRNLDHIMATNLKTHSLLRIMVEEIIWGQGILECVRFYHHQYILSSVKTSRI